MLSFSFGFFVELTDFVFLSPGWSPTCYVAQEDLTPDRLPPFPNCCDYRQVPPHVVVCCMFTILTKMRKKKTDLTS